jgi:hypothetical protein
MSHIAKLLYCYIAAFLSYDLRSTSYELNCYIAKWLGHFGGLLTVSRGLFSYEL